MFDTYAVSDWLMWVAPPHGEVYQSLIFYTVNSPFLELFLRLKAPKWSICYPLLKNMTWLMLQVYDSDVRAERKTLSLAHVLLDINEDEEFIAYFAAHHQGAVEMFVAALPCDAALVAVTGQNVRWINMPHSPKMFKFCPLLGATYHVSPQQYITKDRRTVCWLLS